MALAALVIALAGAVTGIAALAWNVVTWRRSGFALDVMALDPGLPDIGIAIVNVGRQRCQIRTMSFQQLGETDWHRVVAEGDREPFWLEPSEAVARLMRLVGVTEVPPGTAGKVRAVVLVGRQISYSPPIAVSWTTQPAAVRRHGDE